MFLNPASTRSILANNENASAVPRSKSATDNGVKKAASFNENAMKTPHRNKGTSTKNGQTTQRRRRALGDISNRKAAGGGCGGGAKVGLSLKQTTSSQATQGSLKPGKALFPSSSLKTRTAQVKFSKTPATKSTATTNARLGGGSGAQRTYSKPKQRTTSAEYDGVFGVTTRWSSDNTAESRSPFDLVPEEELNMVSDLQDEMSERHKMESDKRDRMELEKWEREFSNQIQIALKLDDNDSLVKSDDDAWDILDEKLPWEVDDEIEDQTLEKRSSLELDSSLWDDF